MKLSPDPFAFEAHDAFANDRMGRKPFVAELAKVISEVTSSTVFGMTAPWGSGKTVAIRMLEAELKNRGETIVAYVDAWAHIDEPDPVRSIVDAIATAIRDQWHQKSAEVPRRVESAVENLIGSAVELARRVLPGMIPAVASAAATDGHISTAEAQGLMGLAAGAVAQAALARTDGEHHERSLAPLSSLRRNLQTLVDVVNVESSGEERAGGEVAPRCSVVVLIDELDRCPPAGALRVLERLHHGLTVDGVVYVLTYDQDAMHSAVCVVHGNNIDPAAYLRRFVHIELKLRQNIDDFVKHRFVQALGDRYNDELWFAITACKWLRLSARDIERAAFTSTVALMDPPGVWSLRRFLLLFAICRVKFAAGVSRLASDGNPSPLIDEVAKFGEAPAEIDDLLAVLMALYSESVGRQASVSVMAGDRQKIYSNAKNVIDPFLFLRKSILRLVYFSD